MFCRISAVFRCHVLHIFYTADGLRLARETTDTKSVIIHGVASRVDESGIHIHVVGIVARVHGR